MWNQPHRETPLGVNGLCPHRVRVCDGRAGQTVEMRRGEGGQRPPPQSIEAGVVENTGTPHPPRKPPSENFGVGLRNIGPSKEVEMGNFLEFLLAQPVDAAQAQNVLPGVRNHTK